MARVHTATEVFEPRATISSLPLRTAIDLMGADAPLRVQKTAQGLRYRDLVTVALILDGADVFPDNSLYIHDERVRVARIQNYRSWSPCMVPDPDTACVGLEYFCFKGDDLWTMDDEELVALAALELHKLGLAQPERIVRGHVMRVPFAYPLYDAGYADRVAYVRDWLASVQNLLQVGDAGQHAAGGMGYSALTGMRAARAVLETKSALEVERTVWSDLPELPPLSVFELPALNVFARN